MATTRTVQDLSLGSDKQGNDAFLLPADAYICRLELSAATRKDFTVPAGTKRVIFAYEADEPVYVRCLYPGDSDLTAPSGDATDGTAPFLDPTGLIGVEEVQEIQFICAAAAVVHVVCAG